MGKALRIKDFRKTDRPRERLKTYGVYSLADSELLAMILRSGGYEVSAIELATQLLHKFNTLKRLRDVEIEELTNLRYMGIAKAAAVKAALELGLRASHEGIRIGYNIRNPRDVYKLLQKDLLGKNKEQVFVLSLDIKNAVISKNLLSLGTSTETLIHPGEVYKIALANNAVSIILVHNHPSGDPSPSAADIKVTEQVAQAGKVLNTPLLDHIIFTDTTYTSLKNLNLLGGTNLTPKGGEYCEKTRKKNDASLS